MPREVIPEDERRHYLQPGLPEDLTALAAFLLLWGLIFAPVLRGDGALLSIDNRRWIQPWTRLAADASAWPRENPVSPDVNVWVLPETTMILEAAREAETARARGEPGPLGPLWNPRVLSGAPLLAQGAFSWHYPPNRVLYRWLDPVRALSLSLILHVLLAYLGLYAYLRARGRHPFAAWVGGTTLAFSGYATVHLLIPQAVVALSWSPWILLASRKLAEKGRAIAGICLSLVTAAAALGGFPPLIAFNGIVGGVEFLSVMLGNAKKARGMEHGKEGGASRRILTRGAGFLVTSALGVGLACVELLPMIETQRESLRATAPSVAAQRAKALYPAALLGALLPDFLGNPVALHAHDPPVASADFPTHRLLGAAATSPGATHGPATGLRSVGPRPASPAAGAQGLAKRQDNFIENTIYVGVIPFLLALLAAVHRGSRDRRFAVLALLALSVAMGIPGIYGAAHLLIPGVALGNPKRMLFLWPLALAVLAGVGAQRIEDDRCNPGALRARWPWILGAGAAAAAGLAGVVLAARAGLHALLQARAGGTGLPPDAWSLVVQMLAPGTWILSGLLFGGVVLAAANRVLPLPARRILWGLLIAADLGLFAAHYHTPQDPDGQLPQTPLTRFLAARSGEGRVMRFGRRDLLPANLAAVWGIRNADGYEALYPRAYAELLLRLEPGLVDLEDPRITFELQDPASLDSPILDLLETRFVLSAAPLPESDRLHRIDPPPNDPRADPILIYERPLPFHRVFVPRAVQVAPREAILDAVAAPGFDPLAEGWLEALPAALRAAKDVPGTPASGAGGGGEPHAQHPGEHGDSQARTQTRAPATPAAPARIEGFVEPHRGEAGFRMRASRPCLVVYAESWAPGWRLFVDGDESRPLRADGIYLAAAAGAGEHTIRFVYDPRSWRLGKAISLGCALMLLLGGAAADQIRRGLERRRKWREKFINPTSYSY